jgi:CDP-diacylglycerol--glycerol-3-phosphate 3-phosphatidyltransferase
MNLPNQLTLSRLVFTVFFLAAVMWRVPFNDSIALAFFVVASLTDYLDGRIARRRRLITNFGILMDPLADKVLICSAFIAFVGQDLMPAWMVVVIVARELAITGLRLLAASKQVVLAAEGYGKHKTISQMVAIIALLVRVSYPEWGPWGAWLFAGWLPMVAELSKWIAVGLTILSGTIYLWRNRHIYLSDL